MQVLHISTECYPAAKAGGLGDVAGALPKYLSAANILSGVIIPKYSTKWILQATWKSCFQDTIQFNGTAIHFSIQQLKGRLAYPLYVVDIPGKFDRPGVYLDAEGRGYADEVERAVCFQRAVLQWLSTLEKLPKILHCHDHHTGLIPFMVKHCPDFAKLADIPTVFTIHNAEYHGTFGWEKIGILPLYDGRVSGLLDWNEAINPLATAIKCCWKLTTVSPSYMKELRSNTRGLEQLLQQEEPKSSGILNGIDAQVWNPTTDDFLASPLKKNVDYYKKNNKKVLTQYFKVDPQLPLITFIGRLAREKGADFLAPIIERFIVEGGRAAFIILGTGEPILHKILAQLNKDYQGIVSVALEYNERLAHQLYAGSDFLWMPSRVEPCGLNQLYAMRYGTIPIVRGVGGLRDTVIDIENQAGRGIQFEELTLQEGTNAIHRACTLYKNQNTFKNLRNHIMDLDFSWEQSAATYLQLYKELNTVI